MQVPPKMIRALARCPRGQKAVNREQDITQLACWNWALTGLDHNTVNITALYDYVNSGGNLVVNGGGTINDLVDLGYPNLTVGLQQQLTTLRQEWAQYKQSLLDLVKTNRLEKFSRKMATIVAQVYGLQTTNQQTGIELGMHFEAKLKRRMLPPPPENDLTFCERKEMVGIGFEHWWIHFKGGPFESKDKDKDGPVTEMWVALRNLLWARLGQSHGHRSVWRQNVSGLHQNHIEWLNAHIEDHKGRIPFEHPANRQPWVVDSTSQRCTWCQRSFTLTRRRHHCRACGLLFCSSCAFKKERVEHPASSNNQDRPAAVVRVCDTCYTGND